MSFYCYLTSFLQNCKIIITKLLAKNIINKFSQLLLHLSNFTSFSTISNLLFKSFFLLHHHIAITCIAIKVNSTRTMRLFSRSQCPFSICSLLRIPCEFYGLITTDFPPCENVRIKVPRVNFREVACVPVI